MKQAVKSLVLFTIAILLHNFSQAQLKLPSSQDIGPDVRKVITDYPNRFVNLQGELLIEHPQSTDFTCNFKVTGAEQATVTLYSSKNNNVCSWQALMLTTEEFEMAKKKFRALYSQLNGLAVRIGESPVIRLKGEYESPVEEKNFTNVLFAFDTEDEALKRLKVEIVMEYAPMEWKVRVLVYDRDREDNERGKVIED